MLPQFSYIRPLSTKDAIDGLSTGNAYIHAGGTDLLGCLRENIIQTQKIVSLSAIKELKGIRKTADGGLKIGAMTPLTAIATHPFIQERYAVLAQAARSVGSPQLRNQGTIGGNLCQKPRCWYYRGEFECLRKGGYTCFAESGENQFHCIFGSGGICFIVHPSDTAPALKSLNAVLHIQGSKGRRKVSIDDFFVLPEDDYTRETILGPDEILTEIDIPATPEGFRSAYRKIRARQSWDFALAGSALAFRFDGDIVVDGRIVLSGAAPIPWRSEKTENAIKNKKIDAETIENASNAIVADAEPLEKNAYKLPMFQGMIQEELRKIGKQ